MENENDKNIRRYLDNEMTETEKEQFKIQLSNNQDLKEDLQTQLLIDAAKVELQKEEFKQFDKAIARERKIRILLISSFIILSLSIVGYWIYKEAVPMAFVDDFYEPYDDSFILNDDETVIRSIAETLDENNLISTEKAIEYYQSKKYQKAINEINTILQTNPSFINLKLYRGISYYELGDYENALTDFISVDDATSINTSERELKETAIWYKGITLSKMGKKNVAIATFEQLKGSKKYKSDVIKIINKLNQTK